MAQQDNQNQSATFPLRHRITGRMPSVYAHNLVIQAMSDEVVLAFFETILPPKPELTSEDLEQLQESGLLAECVARVTLSPRRFLDVADAMNRVAQSIRATLLEGEHSNAEVQRDQAKD